MRKQLLQHIYFKILRKFLFKFLPDLSVSMSKQAYRIKHNMIKILRYLEDPNRIRHINMDEKNHKRKCNCIFVYFNPSYEHMHLKSHNLRLPNIYCILI